MVHPGAKKHAEQVGLEQHFTIKRINISAENKWIFKLSRIKSINSLK